MFTDLSRPSKRSGRSNHNIVKKLMETSFYSDQELRKLGFKSIGNLPRLISRYARFYQSNILKMGHRVRIDDFCILSGHIKLDVFIFIFQPSVVYMERKGILIKDSQALVTSYPTV